MQRLIISSSGDYHLTYTCALRLCCQALCSCNKHNLISLQIRLMQMHHQSQQGKSLFWRNQSLTD